jgi:hypothetical protein
MPSRKKACLVFLALRACSDSVRVVASLIGGDFFPKCVKLGAPGVPGVGAALDLNGDGVLEIVLFGRYRAGEWVTAY